MLLELQQRLILATFQLLDLLSENIRSEGSDCLLNALFRLWVATDGPPGRPASSEEASLTPDEQSAQAEECICRNISQRGGLHQRGEIGDCLFSPIRKTDMCRSFSRSEGLVHSCSVGSNAECEESSQGDTC